MIKLGDDLEIRPFDEKYLEQVFKLGVDVYGEEEATSHETLESLVNMELGEDGYYVGVITFRDEFAGFICLYEDSPNVLTLGDIVIKNECRNKKIAQRCISVLFDKISSSKIYENVELTVRKGNFSAIKCYEALNFKVVEVLSEYYLDKEDALRMVRSF